MSLSTQPPSAIEEFDAEAAVQSAISGLQNELGEDVIVDDNMRGDSKKSSHICRVNLPNGGFELLGAVASPEDKDVGLLLMETGKSPVLLERGKAADSISDLLNRHAS